MGNGAVQFTNKYELGTTLSSEWPCFDPFHALISITLGLTHDHAISTGMVHSIWVTLSIHFDNFLLVVTDHDVKGNNIAPKIAKLNICIVLHFYSVRSSPQNIKALQPAKSLYFNSFLHDTTNTLLSFYTYILLVSTLISDVFIIRESEFDKSVMLVSQHRSKLSYTMSSWWISQLQNSYP